MKKKLNLILGAALLSASVIGCSSNEEAVATTQAEATTVEATTESSDSLEEGQLKLGMSVSTSIESSKDAGEKDGNAQVDATGIAVLVDGEGKIVDCVIDLAQNKMGFTAQGTIIQTEEFKTKKELGDDYGMKAASSIGKEWYEQAEAIEQYVIGKTVEEVKGISVDENKKATDVDLAASVTIKVTPFIDSIVDAVNNAQPLGSNEGDKLGIGVVTNMDASKDAQGAEGLAQSESIFTAVTVDSEGVVTAALLDNVQGKVNFDATGVITSDLSVPVKSKNQLGTSYGLKGASAIGKEWDEQAEGFSTFIVGKTAQDVDGIAVDDDAKAVDVDLASSTTISVGGFKEAAIKAINSAN